MELTYLLPHVFDVTVLFIDETYACHDVFSALRRTYRALARAFLKIRRFSWVGYRRRTPQALFCFRFASLHSRVHHTLWFCLTTPEVWGIAKRAAAKIQVVSCSLRSSTLRSSEKTSSRLAFSLNSVQSAAWSFHRRGLFGMIAGEDGRVILLVDDRFHIGYLWRPI